MMQLLRITLGIKSPSAELLGLSRADRLRKVADRTIHAPRDFWGWLTDPIFPERVGAAIGLVLLLGAVFTATRDDVGWWPIALYLFAWDVHDRVRNWRQRRRERKQAKENADA